jgi:hypothetical protein
MKGKTIIGAIGLALAMSSGIRLWAKSDATLDETLKWIDKHRADLQAEWQTTEGPTKWQPEDFKDFAGTRDWFWERTIKWTHRSDCPHFSKGLESDGESYSITRAVFRSGIGTDVSQQEATKDASFTRQTSASYTWHLKVAQVAPDPIVIDYKEYLRRTEQTGNLSVEAGTYYYVCILPKPDADQDAIIETLSDQRIEDSRGNGSIAKGYNKAVSFAAIAAVRDKKMADRLASAVGHLISLLQTQKQTKEPF